MGVAITVVARVAARRRVVMICPFVKRGTFEFTLSYAAIKRLHRAGLFTIHGMAEIS